MPQPDRQALQPLYDEVKAALNVGDQMADALVRTYQKDWREMMIAKYGGHLSAWQKADLARRLAWRDDATDEDEEAAAK